MTNISETVTATATANASSGVREPLTTVCLTCTGEPIEARIGLETSRFSRGQPGEARDLLERDAGRVAVRQPRRGGVDQGARALEAEDVDGADERQVHLAAAHHDVDVARRLA